MSEGKDGSEAEFGALPPIPALEQPHAVFTAGVDTAQQLGTAMTSRLIVGATAMMAFRYWRHGLRNFNFPCCPGTG